MIVVMKSHCSEESIEHVLAFLENHGLSGHPSRGVERTIIGVLGAVGPIGTPGSIGALIPPWGRHWKASPTSRACCVSPNPTNSPAANSTPKIRSLLFPLHAYLKERSISALVQSL